MSVCTINSVIRGPLTPSTTFHPTLLLTSLSTPISFVLLSPGYPGDSTSIRPSRVGGRGLCPEIVPRGPEVPFVRGTDTWEKCLVDIGPSDLTDTDSPLRLTQPRPSFRLRLRYQESLRFPETPCGRGLRQSSWTTNLVPTGSVPKEVTS